VHAELGENVLHMVADGGMADVQDRRDIVEVAIFGEEIENLALACRERRQRVVSHPDDMENKSSTR